MVLDSVDSLLDALRRVGLLSPEQVDDVARQLKPHYDDPRPLADYLTQLGWLTDYQVRELFDGRGKALTVGPYLVLDRLGEGGVSEVFKAWDSAKGRVVALKVIRQHLAAPADALRQFAREMQAVPRLCHPNVIKTYDASHIGALGYFAMEFVEGTDLEHYVRHTGPLPVEQACDYVRQVAQGLQHAHQLGLVHRDIKPANLFLLHPPAPPGGPPAKRGPDPVVKVLDWGLARVRVAPGEKSDAPDADAEAEKGALVGTADYIAPEQARDATVVDIRGDIYSLGCTFYYLLTGKTPFHGSLMQKLLKHQEEPPPDVRGFRPDVPEEVAQIVRKMMAKAPEDRYQIPLLLVSPLRQFCPGSAGAALLRAAAAAATAAPPLRPASAGALRRPGTSPGMPRPSTSPHLGLNGRNGTDGPA